MGSTFEADIPGNVEEIIIENASAGSAAGSARYGAKIAEQPLTITAVKWVPVSGSQAGASANYRTIRLVNGGTSGTGTVVIAEHAFSATNISCAQFASVGLSIDKANSEIKTGEILYFSHTGSGVAMQQGFMTVDYRLD